MLNFVSILGTRILKSSIKRYVPVGDCKLNIYYNTSRLKPESETFTFPDDEDRNAIVELLDSIL